MKNREINGLYCLGGGGMGGGFFLVVTGAASSDKFSAATSRSSSYTPKLISVAERTEFLFYKQ